MRGADAESGQQPSDHRREKEAGGSDSVPGVLNALAVVPIHPCVSCVGLCVRCLDGQHDAQRDQNENESSHASLDTSRARNVPTVKAEGRQALPPSARSPPVVAGGCSAIKSTSESL